MHTYTHTHTHRCHIYTIWPNLVVMHHFQTWCPLLFLYWMLCRIWLMWDRDLPRSPLTRWVQPSPIDGVTGYVLVLSNTQMSNVLGVRYYQHEHMNLGCVCVCVCACACVHACVCVCVCLYGACQAMCGAACGLCFPSLCPSFCPLATPSIPPISAFDKHLLTTLSLAFN